MSPVLDLSPADLLTFFAAHSSPSSLLREHFQSLAHHRREITRFQPLLKESEMSQSERDNDIKQTSPLSFPGHVGCNFFCCRYQREGLSNIRRGDVAEAAYGLMIVPSCKLIASVCISQRS
jgi:hypothetical protein